MYFVDGYHFCVESSGKKNGSCSICCSADGLCYLQNKNNHANDICVLR
jgi:hypothetical protein